MKSNDDILKYLSDFMSEGEKRDFEKELSLSEDLRNRLNEHRSMLDGINKYAEIKEDSPYFQNLLPRVRERLEKKTTKIWAPKWAYFAASTAAVILIIVNIGRFNPTTPVNNTVQNSVKEDTSNSINTEVIELYQNSSMTADNYRADAEKTNDFSLEVGLNEISNKESIKEIVKSRIAYPVEAYLLALK